LTGEWLARLLSGNGKPTLELVCEADAPQPQRAQQEGVEAIFDGVLYDRAGLGMATEDAASDAALLLAAHRRWGDALLHRLRGRFSAIIWDSSRSVLAALRDPLGVRPLYYTVAPDGAVYVSPHLHLLMRQPAVNRTIDSMVVAGMIAALPAAPHETAFASVSRVPAGHLLRVDGAAQELRRYWEPIPPALSGSDCSEQFRTLLDQAVGRCHQDGRIGVLLSGGIDSATIGAGAARLSRNQGIEPPCAISIFNPVPEADEEPMQRAVAAGLGLTLIGAAPDAVVRPGELLGPALGLAPRVSWPPGVFALVTDGLIEQALEAGCATVLTGDGGDEWLLPLPSWAAERAAHLDARALSTMVSAWPYQSPGATRSQLARALVWRQGVRPILRAPAAWTLARLAPDRLRRVKRLNLTSGLPDWLLPGSSRRQELFDWWWDRNREVSPFRLHRLQKRELLSASNTSAIMEDAFTTGRRSGMEILSPFLDADLIGFLINLPGETLLHGGRAKALARDYLAPDLPFVERWPPKRLADPVIGAMVEREGGKAWGELGGAPVLAGLGVVDEDRLDALLRDLTPRSRLPHASLLWDVMSLEAWLRSCMLPQDDAE
jgi:asparagine synthetase B (glutamine-hydrolysing)